jgi:hypothetical protein
MKCPSCSNAITSPAMKGFTAGVPLGQKWNCIAFCCPTCQAVLSAQIDPVALKSDIISGVVQALKNTP